MTPAEFRDWITTNATLLAQQRYTDKEQRLAYELGLLTSILAELCYKDTTNIASISQQFKHLDKSSKQTPYKKS